MDKSCAGKIVTTTAVTSFAGLFVSSLQNSYQKHNQGATGVFTRTGSTIGLFAAVGAVFSATECAASTFSDKQETNAAIAGCAAGSLLGLQKRSLPLTCGACMGLGATMWAYQATGGWFKKTPGQKSAQEVRQERRDRLLGK
jgi:hypothetical protein